MEQPYRNRKTLIILDILMVLAILSNAGAYAITNAMAIKKEPTVVAYESNPVAVATTDFAAPPEPVKAIMYLGFLFFIGRLVLLGVVVGGYVYIRHNVDSKRKLLALCLGIGIWFSMLFINFWSDFGYWIGKVLYG